MNIPLTITPTDIRRMNVTRQRLAGIRPNPTPEGMVEMIMDIGCVQIDPISAVARTNHLVPWSRLGVYDTAIWDQVLFKDRSAFEYFAHAAAIVATQDYPLFSYTMRRYKSGNSKNALFIRKWLSDNQALLDEVMGALQERGPVTSKDFEEKAAVSWKSSGWTNDKNITRLLDFLWVQGVIMVSDRKGLTRFWDLAERVLPEWTPRDELSESEFSRRAAQRAIHSLGIARRRDIVQYFTRGRYEGLPGVLCDLEKEGVVIRVKPEGDEVADKKWAEAWYVLADDMPLLEQIQRGEWEGRTTLLSPFDNLIADRARTELLWNYDFRIEIYVPKDKRKYGYYTLSILHDDKIIGRVDSGMDRKAGVYNVNNVYAEPGAPVNRTTGKAIAGAIQGLAKFLGATQIVYGNVPEGWRKDLA